MDSLTSAARVSGRRRHCASTAADARASTLRMFCRRTNDMLTGSRRLTKQSATLKWTVSGGGLRNGASAVLHRRQKATKFLHGKTVLAWEKRDDSAMVRCE